MGNEFIPAFEDKAFREWLNTHKDLSESSIRQYCSLIDIYRKDYSDAFDYESITRFTHERDARTNELLTTNPTRKYALKVWCKFNNKEEIMERMKDELKEVKQLKAEDIKRPKNFGMDNFYAFYEKFKDFISYLEPDSRMLMMILWDTGSRISPILKLKVKDLVYLEDGRIKFNVKAKGNHKYDLYIRVQTAKLLKEYIKGMPNNRQIFFRKIKILPSYKNKNPQHLSYGSFYNELKRKSRKAELVSKDFGISHHWIRAARAHYVYDDSKHDFEFTRDFLHHSSITTTQRYIRNQSDAAKKQTAKEQDEKW